MKKTVFLDRDGTINVDVHYLHKIEDFSFEKGVETTLKKLYDRGYDLIVLTNQSGIARGYFKEDDVIKLHEYIQEKAVEAGFSFKKFYYCPHHEKGSVEEYSKKCNCRKPETGMADRAASDFDIDFKASYMIGDKEADINLGKNCGMKSILVGTGYGSKTKTECNNYDFYAEKIEDILDFIE